jgi:hypothetical protein
VGITAKHEAPKKLERCPLSHSSRKVLADFEIGSGLMWRKSPSLDGVDHFNRSTCVTTTATWNHLKDIDQVAELDSSAQACLDEVRAVLERHGCLDRFGVNLLHKHFEMNNSEILVETVNETDRVLVTKPMDQKDLAHMQRRETQWAWVQSASGEVIQVCISQCVVANGRHHQTHY